MTKRTFRTINGRKVPISSGASVRKELFKGAKRKESKTKQELSMLSIDILFSRLEDYDEVISDIVNTLGEHSEALEALSSDEKDTKKKADYDKRAKIASKYAKTLKDDVKEVAKNQKNIENMAELLELNLG